MFYKITPEELQSEFNKLGYEYDFAAHTTKLTEWKPKIGEYIFGLSCVGVRPNMWRNLSYQKDAIANKMIFRTRELADAAFELIKKAKHF